MTLNRDHFWENRELGTEDEVEEGPPRTPIYSPQRVVLILGLFFGLIFCFVTPPTQVPDEGAYFYRAYQMASGNLLPEIQEDQIGGVLPVSLSQTINELARDLPFHPENKITFSKIQSHLFTELEPEKTVFTPYQVPALHSPITHFPQALAVFIGQAAGAPPLLILYFSRILTLIASILLLTFAVSIIPVARWSMTLLALLPMMIFQMASSTPEGFALAAIFAFVALVTKVALCGFAGWDFVFVTLLAITIALAKPIYLPLTLLIFLISHHRYGGVKWFIPLLLIYWFAIALLFASWSWTTHDYYLAAQPNIMIKPLIQFQVVASEPMRFLNLALVDLKTNWKFYSEGFFGILGYSDTHLPKVLAVAYLLFAFLVVIFEPSLPVYWSVKSRLLTLAIGLLTISVIYVSFYLTRTPVGAEKIDGIQGKYFLWLAPLGIYLLFQQYYRLKKLPVWSQVSIIAFSAITLSITVYSVIARYYLG